MGDFIPQTPSLGTGAGRAQWAQKPGGASGIARSDTCGATMRVPRFSPKTPSSLRAYSLFYLRIVLFAPLSKGMKKPPLRVIPQR